MAEGVAREAKFRDAALELADEAHATAARMLKHLRRGNARAAEESAAALQRAARDVKWLVRRLPNKD